MIKKKLYLSFVSLLITLLLFVNIAPPIFAQAPTPDCEPYPANMQTLPQGNGTDQLNATTGNWQCDAEVTFTAKLASRSKETLNWLMKNYRWADLKGKTPGAGTPFDSIWLSMVTVAYTALFVMILVAALLLIVTRGRSITVKRFIIRFIFAGVAIWFSFSLVKTIYDMTDILQAIFINVPRDQGDIDRGAPDNIYTGDLLNVAWDYKEVKGLRKTGIQNDEAAITSLILIKATAATYYTMFIILIIRKIILWFFILVAPILPLLLFFKPVRNTAKIWIGEFFRWVLYAPLFMIFLRGLVEMWKWPPGARAEAGIPLAFDLTKVATASKDMLEYPNAINLVISGPSKIPLIAEGNVNNINFTESYVLYLIALIMLWMVIIMPWILLRIFLDMCCNQGLGTSLMSAIQRRGSPFAPFFGSSPVGPTPPGTPPPGSAGLAKSIPMTRFKHTPVTEIQQSLQEAEAMSQQQQSAVQSQAFSQTAQNIANMTSEAQSSMSSSLGNFGGLLANQPLKIPDLQTGQITAELLQATNLSIPTMKDIAKYEAAMMSQNKNTPAGQDASRINEMLAKLSGTSKISSPAETQRFTAIKERILHESTTGNPVAKSMASSIAPVEGVAIPDSNDVQQVNLDDYEEVKKTWIENYRTLDAPAGPDGNPMNRAAWLKQETGQIPGVIEKLTSSDPAIQKQGLDQVANILPFLLLGGFSKAEITSYLKAKLEAAKAVSQEVAQSDSKKEEEDTMVERKGHSEAQKTMAASIEAEVEKPSGSGQNTGPSSFDEDDQSPLSQIVSQNSGRSSVLNAVTGEAKAIAQEFISQLASTPLKVPSIEAQQVNAQLLNITQLQIPSMKAVARIDAAQHITSQELRNEITRLEGMIQHLEQVEIKQKIAIEAQKGNAVAQAMLAATEPGQIQLPEVNNVQSVNLDDYEDVKNTWVHNYHTGQPPAAVGGQQKSRVDWLKEEIKQIPEAIELLLSEDPNQQAEGKKKVANILPFLMLGGFSKAEIISYLKAKLEAAKQVLKEVLQVEEDQVNVNSSQQQNNQTMEQPKPEEGQH